MTPHPRARKRSRRSPVSSTSIWGNKPKPCRRRQRSPTGCQARVPVVILSEPAGKGDLERAIADYDQAIRHNPTDTSALAYRAVAYKIAGKLDAAIRDYDRIVQLDPRDARAYRARALVYWQEGSFSQSLNDLDQTIWLDPKNPYSALWREIVARRSGQPSRLAEAVAQLDLTKWPAPIVNLLLGSATSGQLLGAVDDSDPKKRNAQRCEANFYAAELALQRGAKDDAQRLFDRAATDCPKTFVERHAAGVELAALNANR